MTSRVSAETGPAYPGRAGTATFDASGVRPQAGGPVSLNFGGGRFNIPWRGMKLSVTVVEGHIIAARCRDVARGKVKTWEARV
jgi:hypothetical protein